MCESEIEIERKPNLTTRTVLKKMACCFLELLITCGLGRDTKGDYSDLFIE